MKRALIAALLVLAPVASAAEAPIQFATIGLRAPNDPHVSGMRFSLLHGRNDRVRGLDMGLIAKSHTGNLTGCALVAGLGQVDGQFRGASIAAVNIHRGTDEGMNGALFNRVRHLRAGANVALVNVTDDFAMVDVGGVNVSGSGTVQVGLVNVTRRIRAVQLGLINVADNGFLPFFPFFNFPKN